MAEPTNLITVTMDCEQCGRSDEFRTDDVTDPDHPDMAEDIAATMSDAWEWARRHGGCLSKGGDHG